MARMLNTTALTQNGGFDERKMERTRIAQELHDTLLQGFLSASMQVQAAADCLPAGSHIKATLKRAVDVMRDAIEECRHAVCGLRSSQCLPTELPEAFSGVQDETMLSRQSGDRPNFHVFSEGLRKPLRPVIQDEVYRIGREALLNAFRHSHAKNISIDVKYRSHSLRVVVRDDGCGIEPQLLEAGRDGHFGLSGMRERAKRIGARLRLWSGPRCGTELELSVPGHCAFHHPKTANCSHQNIHNSWRQPDEIR
jgi:signal transduction histidine kinase